MLFADELASTWPAAVAAVATALVGAWLTLRVHQLDRGAQRARRRARREKQRCDRMEGRVDELEKALAACQHARKRR